MILKFIPSEGLTENSADVAQLIPDLLHIYSNVLICDKTVLCSTKIEVRLSLQAAQCCFQRHKNKRYFKSRKCYFS